eukprot:comp22006_c1_seq1/m.31851 comp22006_c1_seq1/g.31851  ORF comp22006_c1_seq1/g.31851 comp22006_c1_seq1/m.31851 type:complete len:569 (-) comp22006_c1_seq1:480-2186(-)
MDLVAQYGSSGSEDEAGSEQEELVGRPAPGSLEGLKKKLKLEIAPVVQSRETILSVNPIDPHQRSLAYNPKYEELYTAPVGPENPFKTQQERAERNIISGFVESAGMNDFAFEEQRRTYHNYGYALDPTTDGTRAGYVGDVSKAMETQGVTVWDKTKKRPGDKRKREDKGTIDDLDTYKGPWAKFENERTTAAPTEEQLALLKEWQAAKEEGGKKKEKEGTVEEKSIYHLKEGEDYLGRTFMDIPKSVPSGVKLDSDEGPEKCYVPKRVIHTWEVCDKGVGAVRLFPRSGHLVLVAAMDGKIRLYEYYGKRRLIRTYVGHKQAVRDIAFNNDGTRFLSCSYDRYVKLWDTESGECIARYTTGKVPYCVKFNPAPDRQHMIVAGMADKKIVQWDTTTGEIVQEYDRHLSAVNSITFVDNGNRMVTTSDDKSIRVWEWEIPVDFKYIADPSMHSMPAVGLHPQGKWMAMQSMDNCILIFGTTERFRMNKKKQFKGHLVAGYACQCNFSSDGNYIISGDSEGRLIIWDWKTTKIYQRYKEHSKVTIGAVWHPHEPSQVVTCSWDGTVKIWD